MEKKDLASCIQIEYDNDCFWRTLALSTSKEAIKLRFKNLQINFHKCRFECPIYRGENCCDCYFPLSQKLNLIPILQ